MEPRARAGRHKSGLNFADELAGLLYGTGAPVHPDLAHPLPDGSSPHYLRNLSSTTLNRTHLPTPYTKQAGDNTLPNPFPETLRVLDEIVTDFIIETSHCALQVASYAGRAKLKYTDFEFVMRRDRKKLGRMQDLMNRNRKMKEARKTAGMDATGENAADLRKMQVKDLQDLGDIVGEEGTGRGRGKGRGRRKKRNADEAELDKTGQNGVAEDLGDLDVELDELEGDEEDAGDRHKSKKARAAAAATAGND